MLFRSPGQDFAYNTLPDILWYGEDGKVADWSKLNHFVAFRLDGRHAETFADVDDNDFYIMLNSSCQDKTVKIPSAIGGKKWYRVVDTSLPSPDDFLPAGEEEMLNRSVYVLPARSFAVLLSK